MHPCGHDEVGDDRIDRPSEQLDATVCVRRAGWRAADVKSGPFGLVIHSDLARRARS